MTGPWRTIGRLMMRLGLPDDCLRGAPGDDTRFLDHERDGLRLHLRFDRGPARRIFPQMSVADFGDEQISLMTVEGPPSADFRERENAIWAVVYDELLRFEREAG